MQANFDKSEYSEATTANVTIVIPAQDSAVRTGLRFLFDHLPLRDLNEEDRGTMEIVLAEALNNIVEHAYADFQGEIEIALWQTGKDLHCSLVDNGHSMPNGQLPAGNLPTIGDHSLLPEGGFGWHLIRSLSKDLSYRRDGAKNVLTFHLETAKSAI